MSAYDDSVPIMTHNSTDYFRFSTSPYHKKETCMHVVSHQCGHVTYEFSSRFFGQMLFRIPIHHTYISYQSKYQFNYKSQPDDGSLYVIADLLVLNISYYNQGKDRSKSNHNYWRMSTVLRLCVC